MFIFAFELKKKSNINSLSHFIYYKNLKRHCYRQENGKNKLYHNSTSWLIGPEYGELKIGAYALSTEYCADKVNAKEWVEFDWRQTKTWQNAQGLELGNLNFDNYEY